MITIVRQYLMLRHTCNAVMATLPRGKIQFSPERFQVTFKYLRQINEYGLVINFFIAKNHSACSV